MARDKLRKAGEPYKLRRRISKYSSASTTNQHYGPESQQPDVSPEELSRLCQEFYEREVVATPTEVATIERATKLQSESGMWYHQRRLRLTASNFGRVARRRPTTPVGNLVKTLLYSKSIDSRSLRWGRTHESDAERAYLQHLRSSGNNAVVEPSGLVIDSNTPCLACSPDGLVGTDGLVEYKCPYKAAQQNLTPLQAAIQCKDFCSTSNGSTLQLKKTHDYYYQVQGCLAITKRTWCDFVVWTPSGIAVERVFADKVFWQAVKVKLERFYRSAVLPELALPRFPSQQPIREPSVDIAQ